MGAENADNAEDSRPLLLRRYYVVSHVNQLESRGNHSEVTYPLAPVGWKRRAELIERMLSGRASCRTDNRLFVPGVEFHHYSPPIPTNYLHAGVNHPPPPFSHLTHSVLQWVDRGLSILTKPSRMISHGFFPPSPITCHWEIDPAWDLALPFIALQSQQQRHHPGSFDLSNFTAWS